LKSCCQLVLDVRTSAHPSSRLRLDESSVWCASGYRSNAETVQTVKLTLHHRPKPRSAIYRR